MPAILIAGTVAAKPKSQPFPTTGRPRVEIRVKVEDDNAVTLFRVIAHGEQMAELETPIESALARLIIAASDRPVCRITRIAEL